MGGLSAWPGVVGLALAIIPASIIEPVPHSLAYASVFLALVALLGWMLEARQVAGPPPLEETGEQPEEPPAGPSYWPVILALAIVGIAAGLVYRWPYGALLVAIPLLAGSVAAWFGAIREEQVALAAEWPRIAGLPVPLPPQALAAQAAAGAAIAIERVEGRRLPRRTILRLTFWSGLAAGFATAAAAIVDMLYPRGIAGFGGVVAAGTADQVPPGTKKVVSEGKFWLVNLSQEQGGPGLLALWWKCPHLGCTVPWRPEFSFADPRTGQDKKGWFRCPCHGSTYTDAGVRVFGPAPRSMDMMELTLDSSGRISVNTGKITKGRPDNQRYAVNA